MSFSYWLRILAALTLQVLAFGIALHLVVGVWSQYEVGRDAYQHYQQTAEGDQKEAAERIARNCSVIPLVNPALRDCLAQEIITYQKKDVANKDLQAQQEMAYWAWLSAIVSSIGLAVSVVGLRFIYLSLRQTRQAISNDRIIGEAQVRPYLSVNPVDEISFVKPDEIPKPVIVVKNTGQSPAYDVRHLSGLIIRPYPLPPNQGDFFMPAMGQTDHRGHTLGAGNDVKLTVDPIDPLTPAILTELLKSSDKKLFLASIVTYSDIFGISRVTKFCAALESSGESKVMSDGAAGIRHDWVLTPVHNEAT